jgi:hypothetical protein
MKSNVHSLYEKRTNMFPEAQQLTTQTLSTVLTERRCSATHNNDYIVLLPSPIREGQRWVGGGGGGKQQQVISHVFLHSLQ